MVDVVLEVSEGMDGDKDDGRRIRAAARTPDALVPILHWPGFILTTNTKTKTKQSQFPDIRLTWAPGLQVERLAALGGEESVLNGLYF